MVLDFVVTVRSTATLVQAVHRHVVLRASAMVEIGDRNGLTCRLVLSMFVAVDLAFVVSSILSLQIHDLMPI